MVPEIGHFCVILALVFSIVQILIPALTIRCVSMILIFLLVGELSMLWSFVAVDFSVVSVVQNSHTLNAPIYRVLDSLNYIGGIFLLSLTIVTAFIWRVKTKPSLGAMRITAAMLTLAIGFLLVAHSPFTRITLAPIEGEHMRGTLDE